MSKIKFSAKNVSEYTKKTKRTLDAIDDNTAYRDRLLPHGYEEALLQTIKDRRIQTDDLALAYLRKRQEKISYCNQLADDFITVKSTLAFYAGRVRKGLRKDKALLKKLGIPGRQEKTYAGFIDRADTFYDVGTTDEDARVKLETIGITTAQLTASKAELAAFAALWAKCEILKGECQELVEARDQSLSTLTGSMGALILVCKREFKDTPQALEALGIFMRNTPPKRKKKTTEPVATEPTTEPVTEPSTEPATTEPATTEPAVTEPAAAANVA